MNGLPDGRYTIGYRENDEDEIVEIQNNSFCVNFDLSSLKDVVFGRMFYLKETITRKILLTGIVSSYIPRQQILKE